MAARRDDEPRGRAGWSAGHRRGRVTHQGRTRPGNGAEHRNRAGDDQRNRAEHGSRNRSEPSRRYPWDDDPDYATARTNRSRRLPPLPRDHPGRHEPQEEPPPEQPDEPRRGNEPPRKLTVTRVAAWRTRNLSQRAVRLFFSAANADGADRSGLGKFIYAVMGNYAVDAAMAVALANTLFFSAATAESRDKVALYLLITVAPFALIAPVIGPALDRIQQGRRGALAASFGIRVVLAVVMALNFDSWLLYPAALGCMVMSKSFGVLKAAMTPRVLPDEITLTKANSRLTTFGMAAGGVFGAVASGCAYLFGSEGALWYMAALAAFAAWLCLRIPAWVESTAGEVPAVITSHARSKKQRTPMTGHVVVALWGNGSIRVLTGFLTLFAAFVIKAGVTDPVMQLGLLGLVGGAAGAGSFLGNAVGAQLTFHKPDQLIIACLGGVLAATTVAAVFAGLPLAVVVALVGASASALAKVCLDAVIQRDMPERSRASAFGRSETILQLSWVLGGALGVLLPPEYWIGFTVVAGLLALGFAQTVTAGRGGSLIPRLRRAPEPATERARQAT
ncbi:MFS transporter [Allosaccharopolyspora coralli]|uniref:MFS transporter n=1 Tax=Allosaccharopolyspora coralli TaxID=2665642 RepID=A0A5Q3QAS7_9PSEU|nr:MFS transporter [Allosaccharopolyspora coralli]QGK68575.1 MFS transporter [Allosaccharopolyspora coralli]